MAAHDPSDDERVPGAAPVGAPPPAAARVSPGHAPAVRTEGSRADRLLERIADCYVLLDRDFRFVDVNAAAERSMRKSRAELLGRSHREVFPASHDILAGIDYGRSAREGVELQFTEHYRDQGSDVHLELNTYPSDDGGVTVLWRDVTARVRAEQALRESEAVARDRFAELEQIYRYAPVGLCALDRSYRYTRVNERMAAMNGMPIEAHLGRSVRDVLPHLADHLIEVFRPVLEDGVPALDVELHGETRAAPGVPRDWIINYHPLHSGSAEVIGVIVAVIEVTDRKAAETRLREREAALAASDARLRAVLAAVPVGVLVADADGRLPIVNAKAVEIVGGVPPEVDGAGDHGWCRGVWTDTGKELRSEEWGLARALSHGEGSAGERIEILRPDGGRRSVLNHAAPIHDAGGRRIGAVAVVVDVTAQVAAEAARQAELAERAAWFRSVFEQAPMAVVVGRGRTLDALVLDLVNPRWAEMLPAGRATAGLQLADALPELTPELRAIVAHVLASGGPVVRDGLLQPLDRDGDGVPEDYYFNFAFHPLRGGDGTGAVDGLVAVGTEITDSVRARQEAEALAARLAEGEARTRVLFRDSPVPMWVLDRETQRILDVNEAAVASYGWAREEFLRLAPSDLRPPESPDALGPLLADLHRADLRAVPARHRTRDGTLRDVEVTSQATTYGGRPACIVLAADVTERQRATAALRTSEERYALAARATRHAVWDWDLVTGTVAWNPGAAQVLGYSADDVGPDAAWWMDRVHPDERQRVLDGMHALHDEPAGPEAWESQYRFRRADGRYVEVEDRGYVVRGADGRAVRMIGAMADVTAQRQLEERLRQAQKMEAVGQLAGGVAHDFNNLLTIITGNLEFLRTDLPDYLPADHPARQDATEIAQATERARTLVQQLLTFSRKQPVQARRLAVAELVHGAERLLRRVIGEEIALAVELAEEPTYVDADPGQLEQVLMNLAVNARDAMLTPLHGHHGRGGTLTLAVDAVTLDARETRGWEGVTPGRWVRLRVRDTGHGMDAATQAHIFEPFFTTKDVGAGTGLGLATVFGIVRQAGGALRVDSAPGAGATFTVLLPSADAGALVRRAPPTAAAPTIAATVLLVEDEPAVRVTTRRVLERRGYTVREAANGAQALEIWTEYGAGIDVVVTDVRMPTLGGPGLVARLRSERPALPVVFVSGYSDGGALDAPMPARAQAADGAQRGRPARDAFVSKPFSGEALLAAVAQVLGPG